ncbi:MAG TPA: amidohydrolase family protein [Acidimicrobiia bacterium]|nr:amidohydrolase family protein [Acidimicrobiia bacterium]
MIYDIHAHCVPTELINLLKADGHRFGIDCVESEKGTGVVFAGKVKAGPLRPYLADRARRLESLDQAGIDVQVLASWIDMTGYALDGRSGAAYSRRLNEIIAEEAATSPGRFLAMGTVPLQAPEAAAEELRYLVKDLGMVGVEISTTVDGTDLDRAGLDPFWAAASELSCPVLIHPYQPLAGVELRNHLDNMIGRPAESTVAIANLMLSGVFDRHSGLKIILVHGGGFLPFQLGRLEHGFRKIPHLAAQHAVRSPAEIARDLYFYTVLHSPQAVAALIALVGVDRVLLGSDYPFEMGDLDPLATLRATPGVGDDQFALITERNFLGILEGVRR